MSDYEFIKSDQLREMTEEELRSQLDILNECIRETNKERDSSDSYMRRLNLTGLLRHLNRQKVDIGFLLERTIF